jgi:hypothetical protein
MDGHVVAPPLSFAKMGAVKPANAAATIAVPSICFIFIVFPFFVWFSLVLCAYSQTYEWL